MSGTSTIMYLDSVRVMRDHFSENMMQLISDALQCYGRHPEDHTYDEELKDIRLLAYAFDWEGYNAIDQEHDILSGWKYPDHG